MKNLLLALMFGALMFVATPSFAQEVVPVPTPTTTRLGWNASPASEEILGYRLYELTAPGSYTMLVEVNAATTEVNFPAMTPGVHTLVVRAYNVAGESGDSAPLVVRLVVVPAPPTGLTVR